MNSFFYTSVSGWIAVILVCIEIALPYLLRRNWLSVRLGVAQSFGSPYLRRMSIHYWLGYLVAGLSLRACLGAHASGAHAAGEYDRSVVGDRRFILTGLAGSVRIGVAGFRSPRAARGSRLALLGDGRGGVIADWACLAEWLS